MCSTIILRVNTIFKNTNIQKISLENYTRSYITFIKILIIKSISTDRTFSYDFINEEVFVPAYLSGYPIQVTL